MDNTNNKVDVPDCAKLPQTLFCTKCKKQIVSGNFYTINNFHYHSDCFHCFKCKKTLVPSDSQEHDDKLLVLENGTLICSDCSDSCNHCGKKINDLAIILSNNEAYCPDCFKCAKCNEKITDLKYAKTKKGIFCIKCHQVLLNKRKLYKERYANAKSKENLELAEKSLNRTPKRNNNRIPTTNNSFSSSSSLISSHVSNHSMISHRTTNTDSTQNILALSDTSKLAPPVLKNLNYQSNTESIGSIEDTDDTEDKSKHIRNVSIDDMLNATLDNDEFKVELDKFDDEDMVEHDATDISFIHKTPVKHNMESIFSENSLIDDYDEDSVLIKQSMDSIIPQELQNSFVDSDKLNSIPDLSATPNSKNSLNQIPPLNSPMSKMDRRDSAHGLALDLPLFRYDNPRHTNIKPTKTNSSDSASNNSSNSTPKIKDSLQNFLSYANTQNEFMKSPSNNDVGSPQQPKSKRLGRSFSMKSKQLFQGLKNKTTESPKSTAPAIPERSHSRTQSTDTHSGWGVNKAIVPKSPRSDEKSKFAFKGRSDTILYHKHHNEDSIYNSSLDHSDIRTESKEKPSKRKAGSFSSTTTPNVAMYRTPPLENNPIFNRIQGSMPIDNPSSEEFGSTIHPLSSQRKPFVPEKDTVHIKHAHSRSEHESNNHSLINSDSRSAAHNRSISWQTALHLGRHNELDEDTPDDSFVSKDSVRNTTIDKDLAGSEVKLRRAKLDLVNLDNTKQQLNLDIERLLQQRKNLIDDIEHFKSTRERLYEDHRYVNKTSAINIPDHSRNTSASNNGNIQFISTPGTYIPQSPPSSSKQKFWKFFNKDQINSNHPRSKISPVSSINVLANDRNGNHNNSLSVNSMNLTSPMNNFVHSRSSSSANLHPIVLSELCKAENTDVPNLITKCIDFIESSDEQLQTEGLYRKSGSQAQIEIIEHDLYTPNGINNQFEKDIDINVVTSVLKRFLRRLDNPVLTFSIYEPLIEIVRENDLIKNISFTDPNPDAKLIKCINNKLQSLLFLQLPSEHLNLLQLLINHVNKISAWKDQNLMSLHNLSVVFAPGLIRDANMEKDLIDMKERNYIIEYLFTYRVIV